jgi:hypothetical protein
LILLRIKPDGSAEEEFNGPGSLAWRNAGQMQKNGQRSVSLSKLKSLMAQVPREARLPAIKR